MLILAAAFTANAADFPDDSYFADGAIIDLDDGTGNITDTTSAGKPVLIKGESNGARSVAIENATEIYIAYGTKIVGPSANNTYALSVTAV